MTLQNRCVVGQVIQKYWNTHKPSNVKVKQLLKKADIFFKISTMYEFINPVGFESSIRGEVGVNVH